MPNLVNEILLGELEREFESMGSCLVVSFDKLSVECDQEIRRRLGETGVTYRVVKNRLALRALETRNLDLRDAFRGKCGVVFAPEEKAIAAAKAVREVTNKMKPVPVVITGGIIEGQAITGAEAAGIADMPDRNTVHGMIATAVSGPARMLATVVNGLAAGLARCIQARIDQDDGS